MHLWNRARAAFGCVASVCRAIKLGSEGVGARHKNWKFFFSHKVWVLSVIRMLKGGMSAVKDVPRACGIQVSWPIIVGPVLGKRQSRASIEVSSFTESMCITFVICMVDLRFLYMKKLNHSPQRWLMM